MIEAPTVVYYALKPLAVSGGTAEPGDIILEANGWRLLTHYVREADVAPVLFRTLPPAEQEAILAQLNPVAAEPESPKKQTKTPAAATS